MRKTYERTTMQGDYTSTSNEHLMLGVKVKSRKSLPHRLYFKGK